MTDPCNPKSAHRAWAPLAQTAAGGLLAIAASIVAIYWTSSLESEREYRELRRTKIEEFSKATYEHFAWLDTLHLYFTGRKPEMQFDELLSDAPVIRVKILQSLYFPEIAKETEEFLTASNHYQKWLRNNAKKMKGIDQSEKEGFLKQFHIQLKEVYLPLVASHNALLKSVSAPAANLE